MLIPAQPPTTKDSTWWECNRLKNSLKSGGSLTIGIDLPAQFFKNRQTLVHRHAPILPASRLIGGGKGIKGLDSARGSHKDNSSGPVSPPPISQQARPQTTSSCHRAQGIVSAMVALSNGIFLVPGVVCGPGDGVWRKRVQG
jgi:hypothetical protein